jgi:uracil phosphoribosyltransferase
MRVPLHIVEHPLVHDALIQLRAQATTHEQFRQAATRISLLLVAEALRDLPSEPFPVQTPLAVADGRRVASDVVVVPVLRAGLGMLDAVLTLVPGARVGHIGLQRDESTAVASQYYSKLPARLDSSYVLMIDPMLATGGSAVAAHDLLRAAGARTVRLVCIVAAPEGVAALEARHPTVEIYTPVVDTRLNAQKYIVPGLGDFGDRLYGTV